MGRKGGGTSRPETIPRIGCAHRSTWGAKRPWNCPNSGYKGPIRTRLGRVKSPRKQITNSVKGERWNGRGGSESRGSEPTHADTRFETLQVRMNKSLQLRRWEWRDVVVGWEGRGNKPSQADARLGEVITGKEQSHWFSS